MEQIGKFIVEKSQIELNQVSLNLPLLTNISNGTGAEYYSWESRSVLVDKIKSVKSKTRTDKSVVLNENKWVMIILIILLTIEWVFRKRIGLP